jgi:RND family efflux transporter MFP subunit
VAPLLLLSGLLAGCGGGPEGKAGGEKKVVVDVTTPTTAWVCNYQDFTGRLDAYRSVDVKPRVSGYLDLIFFKDGDEVEAGQRLFQIDPRPYEKTLAQAEGNYIQAQAEQALQEKNVRRARQMYATQAINKEEFDQISAAAEKSTAAVVAMKAARDRARLDLEYTDIRVPPEAHTGVKKWRISRRMVDPGNLVTADNTLLTRLVAEDPVYAYFEVDERTYLNLVQTANWGRTSSSQKLTLPVLMRLANEEDFVRSGTITFLDNRVTSTTGTITMRAEFDNPYGIFKAGLFVRIRLPIGTPYEATLIPDEAIVNDQGRKNVYLVRDDNTAEYRAVTLGQAVEGMRVLESVEKNGQKTPALQKGERVVVHGTQQVRKDAKVEIHKEEEARKLPPSTLVKLLNSRKQARPE